MAFALEMKVTGRSAALLLLAGFVAAACSGSPSTVASHSPTATAGHTPPAQASPSASAAPSASPPASPEAGLPPLTGSYGVLVTPIPGSTTYTVSIVAVDGRVVASAQASSPPAPMCGASAAPVPPPISTSDRAVYYMDAAGAVRYLTPSGKTGLAGYVAAPSSTRRSMFAVSPDDQQLAVVIVDFTSGGATTRLHILDFGVQDRPDSFTESGPYTLWPVGWHGTTNLVLAKVPSCTTGGGPFCCGPQELHVVDPATATRRFTLGGPGCVIAGPPSTAGVVCEETAGFATFRSVNWTSGVSYTRSYSQGAVPAYLSPDGSSVAVVAGGTTYVYVGGSQSLQACEWIDNAHLLAGGDTQQQPRLWDFTKASLIPVAATGDCAGRLPGGL